MEMTKELTNEEIVTKLLTSKEIIKSPKISYISNPSMNTLGDFLLDIDEEFTPPTFAPVEIPKYVFIKQ